MLMIVSASPGAGAIHPDCLDHPQPQLCSRVAEELTEELGRFNEAFNPPLPQTLTWVRQGGGRARPFVVLTDRE